ncbi:MAG: DNA-binding protein [Runella slithyformis]|nr:MAG: DNA-binding protein [Runella slithyformis]
MSATIVQLSLPEDQLRLLERVYEQNAKLLQGMNGSVWLSEEEAAARVKVSVSTLRKWRADGWLRYQKIEKVVFFKAEHFDEDVLKRGCVSSSVLTTYKSKA